ncbi:MAG TPA: small ribosomal subunit Rsm22 family protein [Candidatus Acidoferrales bacterium]|nr:small ribosomal subunit Rsm22 family protein [Candidatus Acidoferrales bacterium]
MQLPQHVRRAIEERAETIGFAALKRAARAMSDAYREGRTAPLNAAERTGAYLATRMPATYAAAHAVLSEVRARLGETAIEEVLDVGAGTGAAALAARECWGPATRVTMIERDGAFTEAARQWLPDARVLADDLMRVESLPPHDLVMAAYSVGELVRDMDVERWAALLWRAARVALVVIEPGTTPGYSLSLGIRDQLLKAGAYMVAPCPAAMACPLTPPDWCHFAARVERSSLHRRIKDADLGYEDEKFSYVALAREPVALPQTRIIGRPHHAPGLIELRTCTEAGLRTQAVRKRDREAYRAARHAGWGDALS